MAKTEPKMFYLHVHVPAQPRVCYWLYTEPTGALISGKLHTSAHYAEAFLERDMEQFVTLAKALWPGCSIQPWECDSSKLIPVNMRRLMNIA